MLHAPLGNGAGNGVSQRSRRDALPADIIDALPGAFYILDATGHFLVWNGEFEAISGYSEREIPALHALTLFEGDDASTIARRIADVFLHGTAQADVELKTKSGRKVPFHFTGRLIDFKGKQCVVGMGIDISERKRAERLLEHSASHDALTGLANRSLLDERLSRATHDAHVDGAKTIVAFIDLDRFKNINDTLGHLVGDELLKAVARRLCGCSRRDDTVARLGGDEFIIVANVAACDDVPSALARYTECFRRPFIVAGHVLHVTASIGVTVAPLDGLESDHLLRNADAAMYQAKDAGRNRCLPYTQDMRAAAERRLRVENDLRRAVENEEFELFYQPTIALKSATVAGAEALIRWRHPQHGLLPPSHFIDIAEDTGLIVPIGTWVLREGIRQAQRLAHLGMAGHLSLNVSGKQLRDPAFLDDLRAALHGTELQPNTVGIEITESAALGDPGAARNVLLACKDLGLLVFLDDFGTHYSSLTYLKKFPIDIIKIDKSFVDGLPDDADDAGIVDAIVGLGRNLGCSVLAEGIESERQARWLTEHGCDYGTGYWYARPMPAAEYETWPDPSDTEGALARARRGGLRP